MLRLALLSATIGCGFRPAPLATSDGVPDAPVDVAIDARVSCHDQWLDGSIRFNAPARLAELASPYADRDPYVRPDELAIYLSSNRADMSTFDVYVATRGTVGVPFDPPVLYAPASTSDSDGKMSMTDDGLYLVVANNVLGDSDLWEAARTTLGAPFGSLTTTHFGSTIDNGNFQQDPWISADADRIYFSLTLSAVQHIALTTRTAPDQNFTAATIPASLDSGTGDADPALSADERVIVFSSHRPLPGFTGVNLWYATRDAASSVFAPPIAIPDVNAGFDEADPVLSGDLCTLYFASNATGNYAIYAATAR